MSAVGLLLLVAGSIVVLIGSIGLLRLPDFFSRMHGAGVVDTLGAWLVLSGLLLLSDNMIDAFKIFMIAVLFYFLSPVVSHAISRAAMKFHPQSKDAESVKSK